MGRVHFVILSGSIFRDGRIISVCQCRRTHACAGAFKNNL